MADDPLRRWLDHTAATLKEERAPMEALWRDIRDHFEPVLGRALGDGDDPTRDAAARGDEKIINSKPRDLVSRLSSGLQSGITNQARQWFRLVDAAASARRGESRRRKAVDDASEIIQNALASSNAYVALVSLYMRLGQFGTACALLLPDDAATLRLDVIDEGAYWIGQDRRGRVCTLLRRCDWTISQIVAEFGDSAVPDAILREYREGRGEKCRRVWNLVAPTGDLPQGERQDFEDQPFVSVYWLDGGARDIIARRGFWYNPIIAPRWSTPTGGVYGVGLGQKALSDAKELQAFEKSKLRIVAQEAEPPMAVPERMRGARLSLNPGAIVYYSEGSGGPGGHIPVQPLDQRPKRLDYVMQCIADLEQRLGRLFFEDLFAMLLQIQMGAGKRQMTATEVSELAAEKTALLGPILTRLNHDLLDPLVSGVYAICLAAAEDAMREIDAARIFGAEPDSAEVQARAERFRTIAEMEELELDVEYTSALHADQIANSKIAGIIKTYEFAGMVANFDPQVIDRLDGDEALKIGAEAYMEHGIVRDDEAVDAIREGRAQQQEQQMALAQRKGNADVAATQARMMRDIEAAQAAAGGGAAGGAAA